MVSILLSTSVEDATTLPPLLLEGKRVSMNIYVYGIYTYTPWRIGVPTKTTKCRNRYILYMYIYIHIIWILWVYIFVRDDLQMEAPKKMV